MPKRRTSSTLVFILALVFAGLLGWFGFKLLAYPGLELNSNQLFLLGLFIVMAGVVIISTEGVNYSWLLGGILIAAGFYYLARANDAVHSSLLARFFGVSCLGAAVLIVFMAWPRRDNFDPPPVQPPGGGVDSWEFKPGTNYSGYEKTQWRP